MHGVPVVRNVLANGDVLVVKPNVNLYHPATCKYHISTRVSCTYMLPSGAFVIALQIHPLLALSLHIAVHIPAPAYVLLPAVTAVLFPVTLVPVRRALSPSGRAVGVDAKSQRSVALPWHLQTRPLAFHVALFVASPCRAGIPSIHALRFATPVSARPAPWLKPSRVIVGKRRKKSRVGTGKIGQLYALLRERLAGRAAMNVMVFAIGKYSFILPMSYFGRRIVHDAAHMFTFSFHSSVCPATDKGYASSFLNHRDTPHACMLISLSQTICMRSTHLRERMSSPVIHTSKMPA
jgi:hypothetical protein